MNDSQVTAGTKFGSYQLEALLGKTAFSQSFKATRARDSEKGLYYRVRTFSSSLSGDDNFFRYISFTLKLLDKLDHPALVPVIDHGKEGETLFYVTPFIEGVTIKEIIDHSLRGQLKFSNELPLAVLVQLVQALEYASRVVFSEKRTGISHSNISPNNVLITPDGAVRLMDFRPPYTRADLLDALGVLPRPRVSPEMISYKPVGVESDIFLLGLLLYEMVFNEPFIASISTPERYIAKVRRKIPLKNDPPSWASRSASSLIAAMLNIKPEARVNTYKKLQSTIQSQWRDLPGDEARNLLQEYYSAVTEDEIQDIMAEFKDELVQSLEDTGEITLGEAIDLDAEDEGDVLEETLGEASSGLLDYEALDIGDHMQLLAITRELLRMIPDNKTLIDVAYGLLETIRTRVQVSFHFEKAADDLEQGNIIDACVQFLLILGLDPGNIKAYHSLQAQRTSLGLSDKPSTEAESLYQKTLQSVAEERFKEAMEVGKNVDRRDPYGRLCRDLSNYAKKCMDSRLDNEFSVQQGLTYLEEKRYDRACIECIKVLSTDPYHEKARKGLAHSLQQLSEMQRTLAQLDEKAETQFTAGDFHGAIETWRQMLQLKPTAERVQQRIEEARSAILEREKDIQKHLAKAETFLEVGHFQKAIAEFEAVLEFDPQRKEVLEQLSRAKEAWESQEREQKASATAKPKEAEAVQDVSPAMEQQSPQQQETTKVTAHEVISESENQVDEPEMIDDLADEVGQESASSDHSDNDPRSLLDRGLQFYGAGDYRQAILVWRKVLAINPGHEQALEYIDLAKEELLAEGESLPQEEMMPPQSVGSDSDDSSADMMTLPVESVQVDSAEQLVVETLEQSKTESESATGSTDISELQLEEDLPELDKESLTLPIQEPEPLSLELESMSPDVVPSDELELQPIIDDEEPPSEDPVIPATSDAEQLAEEVLDASELEEISTEDEVVEELVDAVPSAADDGVSVLDSLEPLENIEEIFEIGLNYYEDGKYEDAITEWSRALRIDPNHKKSQIFLDKAKEKLDAKLELLEEVQAETEKQRKNTFIKVGIAVVVLLAVALTSFLIYRSWSIRSHRTKGLALFQNGDYSGAVSHLVRYLGARSEDSEVRLMLGQAYLKMDKPVLAREQLKILYDSGKKDEKVGILLGRAYYNNGEYQHARDVFNAAKEINPNSAEAILGSAKAGLKLGKIKDALNDFQKAQQIAPTAIPDSDWAAMGEAYYSNQQFELAIDSFRKIRQQNFSIFEWIGKCYFQTGDFEEAVKWLAKARDANNKATDSRLLLGKSYYRLKEYQNAIDEFLGIIELVPQRLDVYLELGTAYLKLNRDREAIDYYNRALKFHPDSAELLHKIGFSYHRLKEYDKAIESYQKAIAVRPNFAEALANLGSLYLETKNKPAAIKAFLQSLKANPDQPVLQKLLRRLGQS